MPPKKTEPAPVTTPLIITFDDIRTATAGMSEECKKEFIIGESKTLAASLRAVGKTAMTVGIKKENILPPVELMFRAFMTPDPRVIIIGQDPYHNGFADGLAFSSTGKPEASLQRIFECLRRNGLMTSTPVTGDLTPWYNQGVMLLNTAFTSQRGTAGTFLLDWKPYFDAVLKKLASREKRLIFILLGQKAHSAKPIIKSISAERHCILTGPHPSPLAAKSNFLDCRVFLEANTDLVQRGLTPINWDPVEKVATVIKKVSEVTTAAFRDDWNDEPEVEDTKKIRVNFVSGTKQITHESLDDENTVFIFTDGAARGNGGEKCVAGTAFFMESAANRRERREKFPRELQKDKHEEAKKYVLSLPHMSARLDEKSLPTNNRAELLAVFEAMKRILDSAEKHPPDGKKPTFVFVSDSNYSLMSISSRWDPSKKTAGKAKTNLDIIEPAIEIYKKLTEIVDVAFVHVTGHCIYFDSETELQRYYRIGNSFADLLCTSAADDEKCKTISSPERKFNKGK